MKSRLATLFIVFAFAFSINAQEVPDTFKTKKFNFDSSFKELPKFKFNENLREKYLGEDNRYGEIYLKNPSLDIKTLNQQTQLTNIDNMPIHKPVFIAKMPVHIPDSSVIYHMQVKKVDKKATNLRLLE